MISAIEVRKPYTIFTYDCPVYFFSYRCLLPYYVL